MTKALLKLLPIKEDEYKASGLFFSLSFCLGVFLTFYFVFANAGFVNAYGPSKIPYAYMTTGVLGYFVIKLFSSLKKKMNIERLYSITFTALLGLMIFFKLISTELFHIPYLSDYSPFLLFIWIGPLYSICAIGFSGLFLQNFNLTQSKRLFALLYSGEVASSIIGYFTVGLILKIVSERSDLLYISAAGMVGTLFVLKLIVNAKSKTETEETLPKKKASLKTEPEQDEPKKLTPRTNKYYLLIIIVASFSGLAAYLSDFGFLGGTKLVAGDSKETVVEIIAFFYGIVKIAEFVLSFVSGRLLQLYGMKFGICALAIGMCFATGLGYILCLFLPENDVPVILFLFLALNRLADRVLRKAIEMPTFRILFQPFEERYKFQVQTMVDGTIKQLTIGAAGIVILIVNLIFQDSDLLDKLINFALIFAVIGVIWIVYTFRLFDQYKQKLIATLNTDRTEIIERELSLPKIARELQDDQALHPELSNQFSQQILGTYSENDKEFRRTESRFINELRLPLSRPFILSKQANKNIKVNSADHSKHQLIELLNSGELQIHVLHELTALGDDCIPDLELLFDRTSNTSVKIRIIEILASIKSDLAVTKLIDKLNTNDNHVLKHIVDALYDINFQTTDAHEKVIASITFQVEDTITWLLTCIHDIDDINQELQHALEEHLSFQKTLLFKLLSFRYNPTAISLIEQSLDPEAGQDNNIYALELMDNLFNKGDKDILLPIFSEGALSTRIKRLKDHFPVRLMSQDDRLKHILNSSTNNTGVMIKAEAIRMLANQKLGLEREQTASLLSGLLFSKRNMIQDLAAITLNKLDKDSFDQQFVGLSSRDQKRLSLTLETKSTQYDDIKLIQKSNLFNQFKFREVLWFLEESNAVKTSTSEGNSNPKKALENRTKIFLKGLITSHYRGNDLQVGIDQIWTSDSRNFCLEKLEYQNAEVIEYQTNDWIKFICTDYELFKKYKQGYLKAIGV